MDPFDNILIANNVDNNYKMSSSEETALTMIIISGFVFCIALATDCYSEIKKRWKLYRIRRGDIENLNVNEREPPPYSELTIKQSI